jgi:hypothetical protein
MWLSAELFFSIDLRNLIIMAVFGSHFSLEVYIFRADGAFAFWNMIIMFFLAL